MSAGLAMLVGVLAAVATMWALQQLTAARAKKRVGTEVGALPEPFQSLAQQDRLWWFHSPTCGPCRAMHAEVSALEAEGRLQVVDVTEHLDVARALSVSATPTTVRVRGGRIVAVHVGVLGREGLERLGEEVEG